MRRRCRWDQGFWISFSNAFLLGGLGIEAVGLEDAMVGGIPCEDSDVDAAGDERRPRTATGQDQITAASALISYLSNHF